MTAKLLYLSQEDVGRCGPPMTEIIRALEAMFREKGEGRVEMPPKPGIHTRPDSFIHAMPAYIPSLGSAGMKWVSGYPENQKKGLPYINGLLVLNDPDTGLPVAVMDCVWITAMRTGAATAVSAKHLARAESKRLGVLGAGVQGFTNLEALLTSFPLEVVTVYDVVPEQTARYEARAREKWPSLRVVRAATPREAVEGQDMVVTAGPILRTPHATIQADWIRPGLFASLVDYDSSWSPAALRRASKFTTDDVPQLEHYRKIGYFKSIPPVHADLGELVVGKKAGRERADEVTLACNLGIALDDMATAPLVLKRARELGLGVSLPL